MRLVIGLGNPGAEYADTRHNLGFRVLEDVCKGSGTSLDREKFHSRVAEVTAPGGKALLMAPLTYMNLSGRAVAAAARFYKPTLEDVLVVCDDFNLPLGQLRFRRSGSHGGHNGLRDVIERLGTNEFPRLRLGVGPLEGEDSVQFCLSRFRPDEQAPAEAMVSRAAGAVTAWLESDIDEVMNRFNSKISPEP